MLPVMLTIKEKRWQKPMPNRLNLQLQREAHDGILNDWNRKPTKLR